MSLSAELTAWTVRIPSAFAARMMRTAISPRLATNSVLIGIARSDVQVVERLPGHHRIFVFHMECEQAPGRLRDHRRKRLHDLDEPQRVANRDIVALSLKRRLIGRLLAKESARYRGLKRLARHGDLAPTERSVLLGAGLDEA